MSLKPFQVCGWYVVRISVRCVFVYWSLVHVALSPEPNAQKVFPVKTHNLQHRRTHRYFLCFISDALLPSSFLSLYHFMERITEEYKDRQREWKSYDKSQVKKDWFKYIFILSWFSDHGSTSTSLKASYKCVGFNVLLYSRGDFLLVSGKLTAEFRGDRKCVHFCLLCQDGILYCMNNRCGFKIWGVWVGEEKASQTSIHSAWWSPVEKE